MPPIRFLIFFLVITGLSALIHYYLWARLVRDPAWELVVRRPLTVFFVVAAAFPLLSMIGGRLLPRSFAQPFAWVTTTWLGVMFFLVVLVGGTDLLRLLASPLVGDALAEPSRRTFFARTLASLVTGTTAVLGTIATSEALSRVRVKPVRVPMAKLPSSLSGYTIVQLSDIHVGPTIGGDFIRQIVAQTNALEPDMVVITGDLVDGSVEELGPHVLPLRELRAKDGVFFVTGNHEYYSGADAWIAFLREIGITVLRNERVAIRGEEGFDLAGVDDWRARDILPTHGPDLDAALRGRDESRALVLLAHQPKQAHDALAKGVCLQLSGHTHGGQIFPFTWLVRLEQPYVAGLHRVGDAHLYVSRGTGYWGPPMRLRSPAEITRIERVS